MSEWVLVMYIAEHNHLIFYDRFQIQAAPFALHSPTNTPCEMAYRASAAKCQILPECVMQQAYGQSKT